MRDVQAKPARPRRKKPNQGGDNGSSIIANADAGGNRIVVMNLAKALALYCVRNSHLENLHSGKFPKSETGDYSDVKVVSPYGEIAWNDLSRISNAEMKSLMVEIVDRVYTFLLGLHDKKFMEDALLLSKMQTGHWSDPKEHPDVKALEAVADMIRKRFSI